MHKDDKGRVSEDEEEISFGEVLHKIIYLLFKNYGLINSTNLDRRSKERVMYAMSCYGIYLVNKRGKWSWR